MQSHVPRSPDAIRNIKKAENQVNQVQFPSDLGNVGMLLMFKKYSYVERNSGAITSARADIQDSVFLSLHIVPCVLVLLRERLSRGRNSRDLMELCNA